MFDRQIQYAVDRLLLEQGVYTPVELLLAEGRLKYRDYETWREGDCVYLEDTLFGDPEQIDLLLEQAAGYARALGLTPEELNYRAWGGGEGGSLHFSRIRELDERFFTRYRTAVDKPQMDLFMDATGAVLANGIAHALTNRDTQEARRLLDLLFNADPGQTQLAGLERLVEASEHIDSPVGDIAEELQHLRCQLVPLADDLLGPGSRHFTAPHWRRMSRALQAVGFDPARPEMHLSYSTHQGSEWEGVKESVESVSGWHEQSVLLCRHARACGRLHLQSEEMSSWFSLCWRFPDQAWVIGTDAEPHWQRQWQRFQDAEPEMPNRDFPAWFLIQHPGLAQQSNLLDNSVESETPDDYRFIVVLLQATAGEVDAAAIEKRRALKESNPGLFRHYLSGLRHAPV